MRISKNGGTETKCRCRRENWCCGNCHWALWPDWVQVATTLIQSWRVVGISMKWWNGNGITLVPSAPMSCIEVNPSWKPPFMGNLILQLCAKSWTSNFLPSFNLLKVSKHDRDVVPIEHPLLKDYMLDSGGWVDNQLIVCGKCENRLKENKLPKHLLWNLMFHGMLPEEFHDLMWVDTRGNGVCCLSLYCPNDMFVWELRHITASSIQPLLQTSPLPLFLSVHEQWPSPPTQAQSHSPYAYLGALSRASPIHRGVFFGKQ